MLAREQAEWLRISVFGHFKNPKAGRVGIASARTADIRAVVLTKSPLRNHLERCVRVARRELGDPMHFGALNAAFDRGMSAGLRAADLGARR